MATKQLTPEQASRVAAVLTNYGVNVNAQSNDNPFHSKAPAAKEHRQMLLHSNPELAAELMESVPKSMAFNAWEHNSSIGQAEPFEKLPKELQEEIELRAPGHLKQQYAEFEARMLKSMEEGATKAREDLNFHLRMTGSKPINDFGNGGRLITDQLK